MDCILAIDVGTQSLRACIIDSELSVLERQQVHYTPQVISRDKVEIDAEILWDALVQACRKLKLKEVLTPNQVPEARFYPYLAGDRHRIKRKSGAFTSLTLNTSRDDLLLALAHGIIAFQIESISEWKKSLPLSSEIYHVGGGASDAYTGYKQGILKDFRFVQLGETTLAGAAKLALAALK
jgi:sugar (pentulose or hexulose) kinase